MIKTKIPVWRPAAAPLLLLAALLAAVPLSAAELFKPLRTAEPPVLDGRLDDPAWKQASPVSGFKTFIPDFGREPSQPTIAYMAYDAENLYFAFKCFDREPDKIKASLAARDTIRPEDCVCINLDSFNDQQSLYAFYVNPLGIQTDSRFASGQEDFSVDFVWYSAGRIDPDGYSVEIRVPFKSLRYDGHERVEMSIFFERRISRVAEHSSYPHLRADMGYAFLPQMMPLQLEDIRPYTLLEAIPAFTYRQGYERPAGRMDRQSPLADFSLTAKYGLTSQLILDATWNPDFSQVEADAGQVDVNLRYDLYFPEKRPFFLEGSEMFLLAGADAETPLAAIVHTRRIVDPRAGLKLSGKIGRKDTLASIFALDELPGADGGAAPTAGFAILRYKRALSGESYIGGFLTAREDDGSYNRVGGLDGQFRITPSSLLQLHGFGSWTKAGEAAPAPGYAAGAKYGFDTRDWNYSLSVYSISRDFDTAAGYLMRNGLTMAEGTLTSKIYPASAFWRRFDLGLQLLALKDLFSGLVESREILSLSALLPGNTRVTALGGHATEIYLGRRFDVSAARLTGTSQINKYLNLTIKLGLFNAIRYTEDPYQGYSRSATASAAYQPSEQFQFTGTLTYSDFFRASTGEKIYDYLILRGRAVYQMNKYLFFRAIAEYNSYRGDLLTDFLASFTYIPGTVLQFGYGSLYEKTRWLEGEYRDSDRFLEMKRGFFFKASYLWRL